MSVKEIVPDLLKLIADVVGKAVLPNVFTTKAVSIQFNNYGTEKYDLWYAVGDRFEFMGILEKGKMHLNLSREKAGGVVVISNKKRTKYAMVVPLHDFVMTPGNLTPSRRGVGTYYVEVNPEDASVWVHYKASVLGNNGTELYKWGVELEIEKTRESVEYPWKKDFATIAPYLRDDVKDEE
ncbi:hypothetical protein MYSTI_02707 [Myxococcus stipitatus DSM 14675]|uniref:Uncharacterized protein n=1 Tax=Myxococcus stipitatus (strain DSM 14675 / JCM 12634 / Mx s8) TaxID=1278073 RepID=L7U7F4_MYXSD|nr:hypothetical protein [Myxococcus stipitatus]AGC44023.1 hypothetical protein MYSTI_02707 [Myxococcus stipitatus DSM 14675]